MLGIIDCSPKSAEMTTEPTAVPASIIMFFGVRGKNEEDDGDCCFLSLISYSNVF